MAVSELAPGVLVAGRYRLVRVIGEGGMGVVWEAVDGEEGASFAVKVLKDDEADPGSRARFLGEARAAQVVRHPHVVKLHGVIELDDGRPALVMELLQGETLRAVLSRRGRLPFAEAVRLLAPAIAAVGAAHELGVVHRDLKPENLFLARAPGDAEPVVKILDFGIAKVTALDSEVLRTTGLATGKVLGTPAYMAPEQVYGQTDLDHRVDVWALGLVLYQTLSGVLPTEGDNLGQVFRNVTARPFDPLVRLVPELPERISALVARMLARERDERPADLLEVIEVLDEVAPSTWQPFGAPAPPLLAIAKAAARPAESSARTAPALAVSALRSTAVEPRRSGARWMQAAALAAGAVGAVVLAVVASRPAARAPLASPLSAPSAKLACPVWRAAGGQEPAGWLGGAAAAVACERARVLLGGEPERTLVPAELLDLPRGPADSFPADPYATQMARDKSLAGARQRAQAVLDGRVSWSAGTFEVELSLERADGEVIATALGRGRGLYQAVRAAMEPLVAQGRLPRAPALGAAAAAWARTADPMAALGVVDLTLALAHNAGGLPEECERFESLGSRTGELRAEGRWLCAYVLGRPAPQLTPMGNDATPAGVVTRLRLDYLLRRVAPPDAAARLEAIFTNETSPRGRALTGAIASCVLGASDARAARELAILAVQSDPTSPEGGLCNPWEQLVTLERDTPAAEATVRAMQAWVPWNAYAWLEAGFATTGHDPAVRALLRRAYLLSPFDTQIADTLATSELAANDRAAARGIALAVRAGGLPLHQVESDLLLVRVESSEARFGAALDRAMAGFPPQATDAGWLRAQRFEVGWRALELAVLLGRGREVADELVESFLDPEPTLLDGYFASMPMRVPAICARSSSAARCFARFRAVRATLPGAITDDTEAFLLGAERAARRDYVGAAKAWRPLLGGRLTLAAALPDVMVDVFERTGERDLADRIDSELMQRAGELHGATTAHARLARRALARGEVERARQLAEQVIGAWGTADEAPPALAEMRRLLERARDMRRPRAADQAPPR